MTTEFNPNSSFIADFSTTDDVIDYPEITGAPTIDGNIPISEMDDHVRDTKQMVWNVFKNCTGECRADEKELSYLDGLDHEVKIWQSGQISVGLAVTTQSGSPTQYVLTTGSSISLAHGQHFTMRFNTNVSGQGILRIDANGFKDIYYQDLDFDAKTITTTRVDGNIIVVHNVYELVYDGNNDWFVILRNFEIS